MKVLRLIKDVTRRDKSRNADIYEEFHIKPTLDVLRAGKFRWFGHVMKREPPSMLHEVVNYKVKVTRPRGRPRTTWLKSMDKLPTQGERIQHERCDVQESVPGPKCLTNTLYQLTEIYIPTWRLVTEMVVLNSREHRCSVLFVPAALVTGLRK